MSQPIIEVNGLSKRYRLGEIGFSSFREETERLVARLRGRAPSEAGAAEAKPAARDFWALRDVSFSVQPGEVVGVIGRNGAGKSTLLKLLSRITEPTTGEIVLRGRVASLLEVGTGFHPELSGRDNIFLNGAILGMKRAEIAKKFDEIVAFAEVDKFIDTPVKRYSSGMYVKLAFAIAAHLEPEILIVDEVLAVGDNRFQQRCVDKMRSLSRSHGMTLLFVSHNMALAGTLCSSGVLLEKGRVAFTGTARDTIGRYLARSDGPGCTLAERTDRAGNGKIRLQSVVLRGPDGGPTRCLAANAPLTVELQPSETARDLTCFFTIMDDFGVPVAHFNSALFPSVAGGADCRKFVCHIPELNLNDGRYRLNVCLRSGSEFFDDVEAAAEFEVEGAPAAILGTDALSRIGRAYLRHQWTLPA